MWAAVLGIPNVDPSAARWALVVGPPLTLMAMVPLMFMREKPIEHPHTLKELMDFGKLPSRRVIAQFGFLGVLTGAATLGLTVRFFNVFFEDAHGASDGQIGWILGVGAVAGAGTVLAAPMVAQRWGKVKSIVFTQVASTPFLLLMALVPSLSAVMVLFLVRGAVQAVAQPMRNQLNMELITPRERGTAAGFTHMAFDLGGGVGAGIAGVVIAATGYTGVFVAAIALVLVAAALYYMFFLKAETQVQARVLMPVPVPAGGSS
jgi:predicted MFS family arabinose efflux permease